MKAAIVKALGQPPVFGSVEEPQAQAGEVLIEVTLAGIKQLDRAMVAGTHYSSPKSLPIVPGTDGVGYTPDGQRVYFASFRQPHGALAERTVASWTVPVPEGVDDATAAALINPAFAAWLPLHWRAEVQPGETVLIIGATGTSGKLAVAAARQAGAGRIVAAGRRQSVLDALGVDGTVDLGLEGAELVQAFADAAGPAGYNVIVDYIWGAATEALLATLNNHDLSSYAGGRGIRLVNVGSMAGPDIRLPAAVLRSNQLQIMGSGTGNFPPVAEMQRYANEILALAAAGKIAVETQEHGLTEIAAVWDLNKKSDVRSVIRISR
ncbi:Alcohol dehydrogenase zinc-binding domain protein [Serratia sp. AS12]|uniref:quinone oxidoreductase family protein n=1 Tax=Serratia TaxID=613 RepID=UPI00020E9C42|nr:MULTISPECIES: zinc-binding alcohol dehydrogenase family protein [Serratia]AEF47219.1 Alcohol dehydrogenase zinc-binding domain protein [Serratia plymuthica AS9]AEF52171.1 Alcohol dehydrogenase zinc-binding domain protein [Serratia sp. AS12]AEG29878.1 Alcohol dehydrogenase zinc-binding domain protein [Serratia sp. AS13]UTN95903.1 zinc-binding alcohol dehydrogenase family protein [Serratia plymuthica]